MRHRGPLKAVGIAFAAWLLGLATSSALAGVVGDYRGRWECVDSISRATVRIIEFRGDGTYNEITTAVAGNSGGPALKFKEENSELIFFADVLPAATGRPGQPQMIRATLERGRVGWKDGDMFTYVPTQGENSRVRIGREYEFHRLGAADREKAGSLIGTWEAVDWRMPQTTLRVTFGRDRSFEERIMPQNRPTSDRKKSFLYQAPLLHVTVWDEVHRRDWPDRTGQVTWIDPDHFTLKMISETQPVLNLPAGTVAFRRVVEEQGAGGAPPARRESPGGRKGDYVGLWESLDAANHQVRVVEFKPDGTCIQTVKSLAKPLYRYVVNGDSLETLLTNSPMQPRDLPNLNDPILRERMRRPELLERGQVVWRDGDLFEYTVAAGADVGPYGQHKPGNKYIYHRVGNSPKAKTFSLVGVWQQVEPRNDQRMGTIEFLRDRTYRHLNAGLQANRPDESYRVRDGVLSLVYDGPAHSVNLLRATMTWESEDKFILTILDGSTVSDCIGKSFTMRRK
jgi:hypothetical protein